MARRVSAIGKAALISREGVRTTAYKDTVGIWTIGVGHTAAAGPPAPRAGMKISLAECMSLLDKDIVKYEKPVDDCFVNVNLSDHQFDALVSICYNIGPGWFKPGKEATFVKDIKAGNFKTAAQHMMNFSKPKEIISRRQAEANQFLTPYSTALPKGRSTDKSPVKVSSTQASAPIAPTVAGGLGQLWQNVTGITPNVTVAMETPPGFKGNLRIFQIQSILREKGFTEVGNLDGFSGPATKSALSAMILNEGMKVSENQALFNYDDVTVAFVSAAKPKVISVERQFATTADVQNNAPEIMAPINSLVKIGLSTIGAGGVIGSGGLIEQAKTTIDQTQGAIAAAKPVIDLFASIVKWITDHPALVLVALGIFCLILVGGQTARIVQMFRAKRIT